MDGKYLDPREALRRQEMTRRRQKRKTRRILGLTAGILLLGAVWALRWIHPVPGACLLALLTGRTCYDLGKEDGYGY